MALFVLFYAASILMTAVFIPASHREYYARTADRKTVLVNLCWHLIPLAGWYQWETPDADWQTAGIFFWIAGDGLRVWTQMVNPWFSGQLLKPRWLAVDGPYRYTRHPGYVGMTLVTLATICFLQQWPMIPLASGYVALLRWQARKENRLLYANT